MSKRLLNSFLLILGAFSLMAQGNGKIAGTVTDQKTGESLPGVNVFLEGTTLGGSSDVTGFYVVLGVPAGTYTVNAQYVGYNTAKISEVRIVSGVTKSLDIEMTEAVGSGEVVEIVAEKVFFEKGATNSIKVVDSEELDQLPVRGVAVVAQQSAGVTSFEGSNALYVRGGRSNQVQYVVDGVIGNVALPQDAIEQISTEIGGFSARYGAVQSGIIHIATKAPSKELRINAHVFSSDLTDYNERDGQVSVSGPLTDNIGFFAIAGYQSTDASNVSAVKREFNSNVTRVDDVAINNGRDTYLGNGKIIGYFDDLTATLSLSGNYSEGNSSSSYFSKNNSAHNQYFENYTHTGLLKLNYSLSEKSYVNLSAKYNRFRQEYGDGVHKFNLDNYGTLAANPKFTTAGVDLSQSEFGVGLFAQEGDVNNGYGKQKNSSLTINLDYSAQIGKHLVSAGFEYRTYEESLYTLAPLRLQNADFRSTFADVTVYDQLSGGYGYNIYGAEVDDYYEYNTLNSDGSTGEFRRRNPARGFNRSAAYLEDKIELEDFIVTLGVRMDANEFTGMQRLKSTSTLFGEPDNTGATTLELSDLEDFDMETYFSPRLGFSFPVTYNSSFKAFYGVFRQPPSVGSQYVSYATLQNRVRNAQTTIRTGNLEWEKTTTYELGYTTVFNDVLGFELNAYYKYQEGLEGLQTNSQIINGATSNFFEYTNIDFSVNKGFTVSVDYRGKGPVSADVAYTYSNSETTGSSAGDSFTTLFRNPNEFTVYNVLGLANFDKEHVLNANLNYRYKGDNEVLEGVSASANMTYSSGFPYTPVESQDLLKGSTLMGDTKGDVNSQRTPATALLNIRLEKQFKVDDLNFSVYARVVNLLDKDNPTSVYPSSGLPNTTNYLNTASGQGDLKVGGAAYANALGLSQAEGEQMYINDRKTYENNINNYGLPRQVYIGLKFNF